MGKEYIRENIVLSALPLAASIIEHVNFDPHNPMTDITGNRDYVLELDPSIAFHGTNSLLTSTAETDPVAGDSVNFSLITHNAPSKLITVSQRWRSPDPTHIDHIDFGYRWAIGDASYWATVRLDPWGGGITYRDINGDFQAIPGYDENLYLESWHRVDNVINFATGEYVSITIDNILIDLSGVKMFAFMDPTPAYLSIDWKIVTDDTETAVVNWDEILVFEGLLP